MKWGTSNNEMTSKRYGHFIKSERDEWNSNKNEWWFLLETKKVQKQSNFVISLLFSHYSSNLIFVCVWKNNNVMTPFRGNRYYNSIENNFQCTIFPTYLCPLFVWGLLYSLNWTIRVNTCLTRVHVYMYVLWWITFFGGINKRGQ